MNRLRTIFASFFKIGLFTFGGGYAMIPLIQHEVTDKRKWVEDKEFLDLLTLAQSVPGPISLNTSVFVGYKVRGLWGAADAAFKGMRPAVVALIIGPVISLARGMHWSLLAVIAASALAVWGLGWSPIYILLIAAAGGIAWELAVAPKIAKRNDKPKA